MAKTRSLAVALLTLVMISSATVATVAQEQGASPEGEEWQLTRYTADGALVDVPSGVDPTLLLEDGQATGNGGCNSFFGTYEIDGASIAFGENFGRTEMFCEGDPQVVEDAYLGTLPTVASWSLADGILDFANADDVTVLSYAAPPQSEIEQVLALLTALQSQVSALEARIDGLESEPAGAGQGSSEGGSQGSTDGDGDGASGGEGQATTPTKPQAPKARGKVKTTFPDWFRDEFRPPADRSENKNREIVKWRNRADNADGVRVYARRGWCTLKPGVEADQALTSSDYQLKRGQAIRLSTLPAKRQDFRPKHEQIAEELPAAPVQPGSNDQFYDVLVAAYNAEGESKRTLVGSFFLTPEFNCP